MRRRGFGTWVCAWAWAAAWMWAMGPVHGCQEPSATMSKPRQDRLASLMQSPGFERGHWGILVVDLHDGSTVHELHADELFCPASVTKLFSGAAALVALGPGDRIVTPVFRSGELTPEGVLSGDLVLQARGDFSLGGRAGPNDSLLFANVDHCYANDPDRNAELVSADPLGGLVHLARQVKEAKVKEVRGDVVIDDRLFKDVAPGSTPWLLTPIVVNDNVVDVVAGPAPNPGEDASVQTVPATGALLAIDAQVTTSAMETGPVLDIEAIGPGKLRMTGRIPTGRPPIVRTHRVEDPASFARALFIQTLRRQGILVSASPLRDNDPGRLPPVGEVERLPKVAELTSRPFGESLKVMLKVSQNLHANILPLVLAARTIPSPTLEDGLKRQAEVLRTLGVPVDSIALGSGSGGSRADLVSPRATVTLLASMAKRSEFAPFKSALPVLGRDGTLATVGEKTKAKGHVFAKTGTLTARDGLGSRSILISKALAGYIETATGRSLAFAVFVNNVPLGVGATAERPNGLTIDDAGQLLGQIADVFYDDEEAPR